MTDLLPHRDGQEDTIVLGWGLEYIAEEDVGNWYSPAAVARMIEAARRKEREECADLCDQLASAEGIAQKCAEAIRKRSDVWTKEELIAARAEAVELARSLRVE